jgi:hypothetical protein
MKFIFISKGKMHTVNTWLKGALKSWTIWLNSVATVLVVMLPEIETQMQSSLSPEQYRTFGLIMLVVNIALRAKTNTALNDK